MKNPKVQVNSKQVIRLINAYHKANRHTSIGILFRRQAPKCPVCGKSSQSWYGIPNACCPKCHATIEHVAFEIAYPVHIKRGMEMLKFYNERLLERQCRIDSLLEVSMNGISYEVTK